LIAAGTAHGLERKPAMMETRWQETDAALFVSSNVEMETWAVMRSAMTVIGSTETAAMKAAYSNAATGEQMEPKSVMTVDAKTATGAMLDVA
jgi:hypothetical protein